MLMIGQFFSKSFHNSIRLIHTCCIIRIIVGAFVDRVDYYDFPGVNLLNSNVSTCEFDSITSHNARELVVIFNELFKV